jgi:hypothetical protein
MESGIKLDAPAAPDNMVASLRKFRLVCMTRLFCAAFILTGWSKSYKVKKAEKRETDLRETHWSKWHAQT